MTAENSAKGLSLPKQTSSENYMPNLHCDWNIEAPFGKIVFVEVKRFSLEPETDVPLELEKKHRCFDYLEVITDGIF